LPLLLSTELTIARDVSDRVFASGMPQIAASPGLRQQWNSALEAG
jgi:hypothetical protein